MSDKTHVSIGVPVFTLLTVLFGVLKVGGVAPFAGWSWWLVMAPMWISFGLFAGLVLLLLLIVGVATWASS